MNLHEDKSLFQEAIVATAEHFKIAEIYIEKDYWVTVALYEIFHSSFAKEAVFKGGTALSKCHKLIERFSEDIDIVILRKEGETDNQLKNKLKTITALVHKVIPEVETELTNKKGQIRKTVHEYQKAGAKGILGQVREHIILEVSWLGSHEPFTQEKVSCYIADFMKANGQEGLIKKYSISDLISMIFSFPPDILTINAFELSIQIPVCFFILVAYIIIQIKCFRLKFIHYLAPFLNASSFHSKFSQLSLVAFSILSQVSLSFCFLSCNSIISIFSLLFSFPLALSS